MLMNITKGRPAGFEECTQVEKTVFRFLENLAIDFETIGHEAAATMDVCDRVAEVAGCVIFKNLFLCNRQQTQFFLVMISGDKPFKTKYISSQLGCARLSFAPAEMMQRLLGVTPGAVTPLGLVNDTGLQVRVAVDKELLDCQWVGAHPGVNTSTVKLRLTDLLERYIPATGHDVTVVELPRDCMVD